MPTLILNFKDKALGEYPLQKGCSLTVGRRRNSDIIIDNLAVSSHHAKIDSVGDGFVLIDLQSKNGSFVNEQQVSSHWLKQGDIINIGKHSLVFCYSENEEVPEDESDEIEKTMVMDTSQYRSMVNKNKHKEARPPVSANRIETIGIIEIGATKLQFFERKPRKSKEKLSETQPDPAQLQENVKVNPKPVESE